MRRSRRTPRWRLEKLVFFSKSFLSRFRGNPTPKVLGFADYNVNLGLIDLFNQSEPQSLGKLSKLEIVFHLNFNQLCTKTLPQSIRAHTTRSFCHYYDNTITTAATTTTYLPTYLPTYPPTYLPTSLSTLPYLTLPYLTVPCLALPYLTLPYLPTTHYCLLTTNY